MSLKEQRLYYAYVACLSTAGSPALYLEQLYNEHMEDRVITIPLASGMLVQLYACHFANYRMLLTKCADEDERAWTLVHWTPSA
jgi:hypothetical protein